jgi:cation transport ATPase
MSYRIIHAIAGRCRIQIPQPSEDWGFIRQVIEGIESLEFVTDVRNNPAAQSLVIHYRADTVASGEAHDIFLTCIKNAWLVTASNQPDAAEIARANWEAEAEDIAAPNNEWQRLGLPFLSLSLALLAAPLELPPLIVATAIAGAAMPWFTRAAQHTVTERYVNVDFLDSLWIILHSFNGQYIAPSLKTSLMGSRAKLREEIALAKQDWAIALSDPILQVHPIQVGDQIWLEKGDRIPADGYILQGTAQIDERFLLGTALPVWRTVGDRVYGSTQVKEGSFCLVVSRLGENTQARLIAHLIESEPVYDTHMAMQQAELVRHAMLPTLCLGGTIFAMTGNIGPAIAPFQLDFGSGIQLSLRTVVLSALIYAAQNGVYIRSGRALEALAHMDTIVFDQAALQNLDSNCLNAAKTLVLNLQQGGVETYLVSGENFDTTIKVSEQIGIASTHTYAEALPDNQAALFLGLRHQGQTVAFVGSHQSAGAFGFADVSIACADQGEVMSNQADVVLLDSDLTKLADAIAIAKQAMAVVQQNTAMIVIPNLMVTTGGIFFGLHPAVNVMTNNCTAFLAEFINGRPSFSLPPLTPSPVLPAAPIVAALPN